jgi:hypothetical protein
MRAWSEPLADGEHVGTVFRIDAAGVAAISP